MVSNALLQRVRRPRVAALGAAGDLEEGQPAGRQRRLDAEVGCRHLAGALAAAPREIGPYGKAVSVEAQPRDRADPGQQAGRVAQVEGRKRLPRAVLAQPAEILHLRAEPVRAGIEGLAAEGNAAREPAERVAHRHPGGGARVVLPHVLEPGRHRGGDADVAPLREAAGREVAPGRALLPVEAERRALRIAESGLPRRDAREGAALEAVPLLLLRGGLEHPARFLRRAVEANRSWCGGNEVAGARHPRP